MKHTITDFENFMYACDGILVNADFDLIEWEPGYERDIWEQKSFYANKRMSTAQRAWRETGSQIRQNAHVSKTNLKHIILVDRNETIIPHLQTEFDKVFTNIAVFRNQHNMFHADIIQNNHWFLELWDLMTEYKEWFDQLIGSVDSRKKVSGNSKGMKKLVNWTIKKRLKGDLSNFDEVYFIANQIWLFAQSDHCKVGNKSVSGLMKEGILAAHNFFDLEIDYCGTQSGHELLEIDFLADFNSFLESFSDEHFKPVHKRLFEQYKALFADRLRSNEPSTIVHKVDALSVNNNFDHVPMEQVFEHFYEGLVKSRYLTESELHLYLTAAFDQCKIPDGRLRLQGLATRQKVIRIFYAYYKNLASKPHGKQRSYAALLGEYFEGFTTENVRTNFTK